MEWHELGHVHRNMDRGTNRDRKKREHTIFAPFSSSSLSCVSECVSLIVPASGFRQTTFNIGLTASYGIAVPF